MLQVQDWAFMLDTQKQVDRIIQKERRVRYVPMYTKKLSFNQKMARVLDQVNEDWCYWKDEKIDRAQLLNQVADLLHFAASIALQSRIEYELTYQAVDRSYKATIRHLRTGSRKADRLLSQLSTEPGTYDRLGKLLAYLDFKGITRQELVQAHRDQAQLNIADTAPDA